MIKILTFFCFAGYSLQVYCQVTPSEKAAHELESKDLDGDGVLCLFECTDDLRANFSSIDSNKDNYISSSELTSYFTSKQEKETQKK